MELRKQPPEVNTQSEEGSLLLPMALRQQPPKVNNQCEELPLLSPLVETIEPPKSLHDSVLRVKCDFELEVLESLSSDSEKSMSPGENTAVSLLSLSDNDNSDGEHITKGLIPQCNWRFEHCFLKVIPTNFCKLSSGCNNFTHVKCAALWSLQNGIAIDDPKSVGLWCREHHHGCTYTVPPHETDNETDCRWKGSWNRCSGEIKQTKTTLNMTCHYFNSYNNI